MNLISDNTTLTNQGLDVFSRDISYQAGVGKLSGSRHPTDLTCLKKDLA